MTTADYEKMYALWRRTPGMGLNDIDDSKEGIERYLARNPGTCFVAQENEAVLGAILSGHDGRRGAAALVAAALAALARGCRQGGPCGFPGQ